MKPLRLRQADPCQGRPALTASGAPTARRRATFWGPGTGGRADSLNANRRLS
jgi:hypothetical protein